jgi:nitroreductase
MLKIKSASNQIRIRDAHAPGNVYKIKFVKPVSFQEKPAQFPTHQVNGAPLKPLTQVLLERRATQHFKPDPVPPEYLEAILKFGAQAPSGYNLQPWRFVVVRDAENRKRLQKAAFDQAKISEAPVVIIAFAIKEQWKDFSSAIFEEGARRGMGKIEHAERQKKKSLDFLNTLPAEAWLNRHTMIAFTTMMFVAEAYGLDTAPMEGFDSEAVKREFGLPENAVVIALLAIGFREGADKVYGGRLDLEHFVFAEKFGEPWKSA